MAFPEENDDNASNDSSKQDGSLGTSNDMPAGGDSTRRPDPDPDFEPVQTKGPAVDLLREV